MSDSDRWYDYVLMDTTLKSAEILRVAATGLGKRTALICGAGFDPRSLDVPKVVDTLDLPDVTIFALRPDIGGDHAEAESAAQATVDDLTKRFAGRVIFMKPESALDPTTQATKLTRRLVGEYDILSFDTLIVDLSGLPSSTSFTILQLVLQQSSSAPQPGQSFTGNLLVTVSDDPETDGHIVASGLESPTVLNSFSRLPGTESTRIWVPVLGRETSEAVKSLADFLRPEEICPVLPFPSARERTGDELILEHRAVIGEFDFEYRNILYASESNPFDLYRQLLRLAVRYRAALKPLGEPSLIVSEHTSKLLSLGVLLAAHEAHFVIAHVRPTSYRLLPGLPANRAPRVHTAWLAGAPYEQ